MSGDIDGDTDAMREFAAKLQGGLEAAPVGEFARRTLSAACPGGLGACCDDLTHADNDSTRQLHAFITQVEQGFAAYSSFVRQTAAAYTHADELARNQFLAVFDTQQGADPGIDPRLEPAPRNPR